MPQLQLHSGGQEDGADGGGGQVHHTDITGGRCDRAWARQVEPDDSLNIVPHHFKVVTASFYNSNFIHNSSFTEWLAAGFTKAEEEASQDRFEHIKIKTLFCYKTIDSSFSFLK